MKSCIQTGSCFIIMLIFHFASSMHWESDIQLRDLEYNGVEFVAEASHWYCNALVRPNNKTYDCNGDYYVGGYDIMTGSLNAYFERTYYTLPAHNQVNISMTFFAMDNWDGPDRFDLYIDGTVMTGFQIDTTSAFMSQYATAICGAPGKDYPPYKAFFTLPHTQTASMTLRIINMCNNNAKDESIAFRDIVIDFLTVATPTSSKCAISPKPLYSASYACPCSLPNQYQNPSGSGTCSFCDPTCATCTGGLSTNCVTCYPNTDRYFSVNQCLQCSTGCATCTGGANNQCLTCKENYYLTTFGTCVPNCVFPLYTMGDTIAPVTPSTMPLSATSCLTPCPISFVLWDGTCSETCDYPLTQTTASTYGYQSCGFSCPDQSQYLYWNGSCFSTCLFPLTTRVQNSRGFCDFPCANTDHFLLWDGSCSTSCGSTLSPIIAVTEAGRKYCRFQCTPDQYLYWDGSCRSTCSFPLTEIMRNGRLFCEFTCTTITDFLYWNGSCISTCNSPLTFTTTGTGSLLRKYCHYPCSIMTDYLYWNGTCSPCLPPLKTRIDSGNNYCDYPCQTTQWLYWDGSCQTSCNFPLAPDLQFTPMRQFCQYYCELNQYMYWNGSCIDQCNFPLTKRYTNDRQFCDYHCNSNEFLYWNGSCRSSCDIPLSTRKEGNPQKQYCDYPCPSKADYLYWNSTCGSCPAPFIKRIDAQSNFCDFPCDASLWLYWDSSCNSTCPTPPFQPNIQGNPPRMLCSYPCGLNQYLYWNGSCADECTYPLLSASHGGRNFCYYPCEANQYLYPNRTCASFCSPLFPTRTEADRNYCDYPCLANQILNYDGKCLTNCPSPYTLNVYSGKKFCDLPCLANYYWMTDLKTCNATCNGSLYHIDNAKPYLQCIPSEITNIIEIPKHQETVTFLTLAKPMSYLRYLEVSMPERLESFVAGQRRNILVSPFGPQIESSTNFSFFKDDLPYIYSRYSLHSSFLVHYWQVLITLLIGIAAAFFFFIIEQISLSERWKLLELVSKRIRVILMWNYPLMVFAWNTDELILFVTVEFFALLKQTDAPVSTPVSFLVSLFFLFLMFGFIYGTCRIIQKRRQILKIMPQSKRLNSKKQFDAQYQNYQILYRGFKDDSILNQFFFVIYMFRIALPMIISLSAIKSPLIVSIGQLIISIDILFYLLMMQPFKKFINQIQLVSYEIIIFMMNIGVLVLVTQSPTSKDSVDSKRIGDLIVVGNTMINIQIIVFLVIKVFLEAIALRKDMKRLKKISTKEKVTTYLQLLALPFQQNNMGFEEMINYYGPSPAKFSIKSLFEKNPDDEENKNIGEYFYNHLRKVRDNDTSQNDTMSREVSLGNRETSMIDLIRDEHRGNHLDRPVRLGTDHSLPTNTNPDLDTSEGSPNNKIINLKSTVTSLRVNNKKRRINKFGLNLDNSSSFQ